MANDETGVPARLPWLPWLPWQREAARAALAQRSSWPHALLIHGPRGIGKHALALTFAQALLCEVSAPDGFLMAARDGQHPTEVARLRGARLLVCSEQSGGRR